MEGSYKKFLIHQLWVIALGFMMALTGVGMILSAPESKDRLEVYFFGLMGAVLFGAGSAYSIYELLKNPRQAYQRYEARSKVKNKFLRGLMYPLDQDITVLTFLKRRPILVFPFLISLLLMFIFLGFELSSFSIAGTVERYFDFYLLGVLIYLFLLSFICFSIYLIGYLATGEILQRLFSRAKRNFLIDLILDYIYAIPFIIIFSLIGTILLFISKKKEGKSYIKHASKFWSVYTIFEAVKYYTYTNLAMISFGDLSIKISTKEAYEFLKKERVNLALIRFRSGLLLVGLFVLGMALLSFDDRFHFLSEGLVFWIFIVSFVGAFFFGLFTEQIAFLMHYIKTRHPELGGGRNLRDSH